MEVLITRGLSTKVHILIFPFMRQAQRADTISHRLKHTKELFKFHAPALLPTSQFSEATNSLTDEEFVALPAVFTTTYTRSAAFSVIYTETTSVKSQHVDEGIEQSLHQNPSPGFHLRYLDVRSKDLSNNQLQDRSIVRIIIRTLPYK